MTVCMLKQCEVRHNAALMHLNSGDFLTIPEGKEAKLIAAGIARPAIANDYRKAITELASRDPQGDCWEWIRKHHPGHWRKHIQALLANDISTARLTYNEMVTTWNNNAKQGTH